jgi:predicted ATPase
MARLVSVHIENFKSIEQADIEIHPRVTVIVGRNNSGKSNVLDALSFLHSATTSDLAAAVSIRGGFAGLVFSRKVDRNVVVRIECALEEREHVALTDQVKTVIADVHPEQLRGAQWGRFLSYSLTVNRGNGFRESLKLRMDGTEYPVVDGTTEGATYTVEQIDLTGAVRAIGAGRPYGAGQVAAARFGNPGSPGFRFPPQDEILRILVSHIQTILRTLILRVGPNRNPSLQTNITGATNLAEDGANLADWLDYHRSDDVPRFRRFVKDFAALVPEVRDISTPRISGGQTTARLEEDWLQELPGFPLAATSFGERNLMTLVGHLVQARAAIILAVEEPENSIHPAAQHDLAGTFWRNSEDRQIIVTTHSAAFLSQFRLESWRMVTRVEGTSRIVPVGHESLRAVVDALGIRPSDIFDQDAIVLVEGPFDQAAFDAWLGTLRRDGGNDSLVRLRCAFISVNGLTNIPFYLDAKILETRVVKPLLFYITDGDVLSNEETADQWRLVRSATKGSVVGEFSLESGFVIEDYLLSPSVIERAYGNLVPSAVGIEKIRAEKPQHGKQAKEVLRQLFREARLPFDSSVAQGIASAMTVEEIPPVISNILEKIASAAVK